MELHKQNNYQHKIISKDLSLIANAYKYVSRCVPETSPRTSKQLKERGFDVGKRYIHLQIHK